MTLQELITEYSRRMSEAQRHGYTAPAGQLYAVVLEDLRFLDGVGSPNRMVNSGEAGRILGVAPKTVRAWCAEGRFPGARKTSVGGEWRIPASEVYHEVGAPEPERTSSPKLWTPTKGGR